MAETSAIEWTDATWNPITGCTLVSEGCRHCYAAQLAATRLKNHPSRAGLARVNAAGEAKFTGEVRFNEQWLADPLRWKRPRRIFVCAHGDLFHESVPDEWIDRVFRVMAIAKQHTFQVLTKRPARARTYLSTEGREQQIRSKPLEWPLPNVWLGTSVEDQATADARIPDLLDTPAAVRFVSAEPLLGPVDLTHICDGVDDDFSDCGGHPDPNYPIDSVGWGRTDALTGNYWSTTRTPDGVIDRANEQVVLHWPAIDWVICGGESGPHARPMHPGWARSLRDQCATAGVSFFFKQWGEWLPAGQLMADGRPWAPECGNALHATKSLSGRTLDGQIWDQMPNPKKQDSPHA